MSYPGRYYPGQVYPSQTTTLALGNDSATLNESASLVVTVSATDTAASTDTRSGANQAARSDAAAHTDAATIYSQLASSDLSTISDTAFVFQGMLIVGSDMAILSEAATLFVTHYRSDSASQADTRMGYVTRDSTDFATESELEKHGPLVFDLASLAETFNQYSSTLTTEVFNWAEQFSGYFEFNVSDEFEYFDEAVVVEKIIETEDPFVYPQSYYGSTRTRVIAQDHFTREFIHWDLPVDNLELTFTLSGPNLFLAKLSTEMPSMLNLNPPLTPDRTWLHVEDNGEIIASFIMTPSIDNPQDQTRQIEGEGYSGYPHWIYYEGDQYIGVQVDPTDMIRKIWDHVQNFPDGNLNVKVWPTVTPVRIGFPAANVQFTTKDGNQVSFQAGPYNLNFWSVTNCGEEINKLCQETPIEFWEYSQWNENKTDVEHYIVLGYPRVGAKRNDLTFREGENLVQLIPSYQETQENYASDVFVIGAGTGPGAVRAKKSGRIGRIRKTNVIQDQTISNKDRAQKIADFEFNRISKSRFLIENIIVDTTHVNARWGTFIAGDDIYVEGTIPYVGKVQNWYRIVNYTYNVYSRIAQLNLQPSDSFSYGATIVNPFQDLPIEGYAVLSNPAADADGGDPLPINIVVAQQAGVDGFNRNNIKNGLAYAYTVLGSGASMSVMPIDKVIDPSFIIIGRTEQGYLITGENVYLVAADGSVGQPPESTAEQPNSTEYTTVVSNLGPFPPSLRMAAREYGNAYAAGITLDPGLRFMGMSENAMNWNSQMLYFHYNLMGGHYNYELKIPSNQFTFFVGCIALNQPFGPPQ